MLKELGGVARAIDKKNLLLLYQKTILKVICLELVRKLTAIQSRVIIDHPFQLSMLFQVTYLNDILWISFNTICVLNNASFL